MVSVPLVGTCAGKVKILFPHTLLRLHLDLAVRKKRGQLERDSEGQEKIIDLVFCLLSSIFF